MSDKVFYAIAGLVAVALIALALVWPPRAETGLHEVSAETAPTAEPPAPAAAAGGASEAALAAETPAEPAR